VCHNNPSPSLTISQSKNSQVASLSPFFDFASTLSPIAPSRALGGQGMGDAGGTLAGARSPTPLCFNSPNTHKRYVRFHPFSPLARPKNIDSRTPNVAHALADRSPALPMPTHSTSLAGRSGGDRKRSNLSKGDQPAALEEVALSASADVMHSVTAFAQSPLRPGVLDDITDVASVAALRKQVRARANLSFRYHVVHDRGGAGVRARVFPWNARVLLLGHTSKQRMQTRGGVPTRRYPLPAAHRDGPPIAIARSHNKRFLR